MKSLSIDSRNEQSPTCEVVHETNKAHFRNLQPNRFLPSVIPLHESNPTAPHNLTVAQLRHLLPVSMADTLE